VGIAENERAPEGRKKIPVNIYWLEQTEPDVPATNQWLCANEISRLSAMRIPKRRADWRLGRWTAKHAVAACLNLPADLPALADIEIRAAISGAPEIVLNNQPADIAISLSHRAGTALCTVAPVGATFGCDLELIEPRSDAFVADYFTVDEKAIIHRTSDEERALLMALLWSGKESALKALRVGLRLDTICMCVSLIDWPQRSAEREPILPEATNPDAWRPLQVRYSVGQVFGGWWRLQNGLVRTVVSNPPLPTPLRAAISTLARNRYNSAFLDVGQLSKFAH
jgi:4'-phosphopantetheinyl transferase